eukprot:1195695-Prorocentrum_minimum.AAC.8
MLCAECRRPFWPSTPGLASPKEDVRTGAMLRIVRTHPHWTVRARRWTVRAQRWTLRARRWTVRAQRWTVRARRQTVR